VSSRFARFGGDLLGFGFPHRRDPAGRCKRASTQALAQTRNQTVEGEVGRCCLGEAVDVAFNQGRASQPPPCPRAGGVPLARPIATLPVHSVQGQCSGQDSSSDTPEPNLLNEKFLCRFKLFHEFSAQEFQPCGFLFAHQPDAALPFVNNYGTRDEFLL